MLAAALRLPQPLLNQKGVEWDLGQRKLGFHWLHSPQTAAVYKPPSMGREQHQWVLVWMIPFPQEFPLIGRRLRISREGGMLKI